MNNQQILSWKDRVKSALTTAIIFVLIIATFMAGGAFLGGLVSSADEYTPFAEEVRIWNRDGTYIIIHNTEYNLRSPSMNMGIMPMYTGRANDAALSAGYANAAELIRIN